MVGPVGKRNLEIDCGIARKDSSIDRLCKALFNGWPELLRNVAANNLRLELETLAGLKWFDDVIDLTELTGTTRLLFVCVAVFDALSDRLAVGDLRLTDVYLNAVGAF